MINVSCPNCHSMNGTPAGQNLSLMRCWNCGAKLSPVNPVEPAAGGAVVGAAIGALFGGAGGAALGAIVGALVGASAGANNA